MKKGRKEKEVTGSYGFGVVFWEGRVGLSGVGGS